MVEKNKEKLEDVTQSPIEVELKGKTYKLKPVGLIDFGDFAQYIKGQKLKLVDNIKDKKLQLKMIDKIMNETVDIDKEYPTINGVCYLAWKAIQKCQPEITLNDMNQIIDLDNFEKISVILDNLGRPIKNPTKKVKVNP